MIGKTFVLNKPDETNLEYERITVLDRVLSRSIKHKYLNTLGDEVTTYEYSLDCLADGQYINLVESEFSDEIMYEIYSLEIEETEVDEIESGTLNGCVFHDSGIIAKKLNEIFLELGLSSKEAIAGMNVLLLQSFNGAEGVSEQIYEFEQILLAHEHEPIDEEK